MKPSNNPDIALAQEWIASLDAHVAAHGLAGFDPLDVRAHPWVRGARAGSFRRKSAGMMTDLFPYASRRFLKIQPAETPEAFALCVMGDLRMESLTQDARYGQRAARNLEWLAEHAIPADGGASWGWPFPLDSGGAVMPANTPTTDITALVGLAFLEAHARHGDAAHLDVAIAAANMLAQGMPRLHSEDGDFCFSCAPGDLRRMHHTNALAAELLIRAGVAGSNAEMLETGAKALRYTLARQGEDGAWELGDSRGEGGHRRGKLRVAGWRHGAILRSLNGIYNTTQDAEAKRALQAGFKHYRTLFTPIGQPAAPERAWPVDIRDCVEGVFSPSAISETVFGTKKYATINLRWAHFFMRDHATDLPYCRKHRCFTVKLVSPSRGVARLYLALAEYLAKFYEED